jgi:K+-transporting ATPase ATPase C chain
MKNLLLEFRTALLLTLVLALLLCGVYPLAVWAGGQVMFNHEANGSLIVDKDGLVRGSSLLAQNFSGEAYFHPRPSAAGNGYDAVNSSGTNLGPTSDKLAHGVHAKDASGHPVSDAGNFDGVRDLVAAYRAENGLKEGDPVPADAVTRSASGLDPHIGIENARLQSERVARVRKLPVAKIRELVLRCTDPQSLGVFGEPGVNVMLLNRALDQQEPLRK